MTTITENTTIVAVEKNAPAKKAPAKKRLTPIQEEGIKNMAQTIVSGTDAIHEAEEKEASLDVESITLENQERIDKVVDNTKILSTNLKEYTKRLDSMHEKSDKLSEKFSFVENSNIRIVFPNHLIKSIINNQIEKVNNKLMNSIDEAQEIIELLERDDIEKSLDALNDVKDLKDRLKDLEYQVEELPDNYYVDDEISSQTSDYVTEYDVNDMIEDEVAKHTDGFVSYDDLREELRVYGKEINALKEQLNKPSLYKRFGLNVLFKTITKIIKSIFGYNSKFKVRRKMSSNNK